jgi:hypothetical protein
MNFRRDTDTNELEQTRALCLRLALALETAQADTVRELAALRTAFTFGLAELRRELATLRADADRQILKSAFALVGEANRQTALAQHAAAGLANSDAMLDLAAELAAQGLLDDLGIPTTTEDIYDNA